MKVRSGWRRKGLLALLVLTALAPAACGKKGAPVLPPPQTDTYPNQYPKTTDPQQGIFN
jgi:predicted small lipoprotein YifL